MSSKSKKSSKVKADDATDVDPAILTQAEAIVGQYQVLLEYEDGDWVGRGVEMPYVFADGPTPDACIAELKNAMKWAVALTLVEGGLPPAPARQGKRTEQVNVRLSIDEKRRLERSAEVHGFKGASDYLRSLALGKAG